jgi:hypothetical protein
MRNTVPLVSDNFEYSWAIALATVFETLAHKQDRILDDRHFLRELLNSI